MLDKKDLEIIISWALNNVVPGNIGEHKTIRVGELIDFLNSLVNKDKLGLTYHCDKYKED